MATDSLEHAEQPDLEGELRQARALLSRRRTPEAALAFADIARRYPRLLEAHANLGVAARELGHFAEAAAAFEKAIEIGPASERLVRDWLLTLSEIEGYAASLERLNRRRADFALSEASNTELRGALLARGGKFEVAIAEFNEALRLAPDFAMARYGRGLAALALGQFRTAWSDYESRWDVLRRTATDAPVEQLRRLVRRPTIDALSGKRIALLPEQGIGDVIMFASMIPDALAVASRVSLDAPPRLAALLSNSFPELEIRPAADEELIVAMGSLGHAFRRETDVFPGKPYLRPSSERKDSARALLGPKYRPRVGLCWRGGVGITRAAQRSIPLAEFAKCLPSEGVDFISLQHGDVRAEILAWSATPNIRLTILPEVALYDFDALAGVVSELDAVISVQTAVIHLCGALGVTCGVLVPGVAEWRYGAYGDTMPWYKGVRIERREEGSDWKVAVQSAWSELADRAGIA